MTSVDIVVNNFNYARYLPAAIDSALAQTHRPVRVVVVDDGSTDDSRSIIAGYGDRIVAVLKANGGQASAFNAGLAACEGDAVIYLDADDVLETDVAALVAGALRDQPDAAKVQWRMTVIDADGRPTGAELPTGHLPMPTGDLRRAELTFPFDLTWMATSGNAFSARALRRILPMPEAEYRVNADWYLQHLTALLGPVVSLDAIGSRRRVHDANAYEQSVAALDLPHVRETIRAAAVTRAQLERVADELGLDRPKGPILSVSDLANRLISVRLDPGEHPLAGDRAARLVPDGVRAAARRFDVRVPMRVAFAVWFLAMGTFPRRPARRLAEWFLFPARRPRAGRLLGALHRRDAHETDGAA